MNVLPCQIDGSEAVFAGKKFSLNTVVDNPAARFELGIRPEHITLSQSEGMPLTVTALEDVGRHVIVRGEIAGTALCALVKDGVAIPENPCVSFDSVRINLYADDYRVGSGRGD